MLLSDLQEIIEIESKKYLKGELQEFHIKNAKCSDRVSFGKNLLPFFVQYPEENYLKKELQKSTLVVFETFPYEVLKFFGDYVHRIPFQLNLVENMQFFEFAHFISSPSLCKVGTINSHRIFRSIF